MTMSWTIHHRTDHCLLDDLRLYVPPKNRRISLNPTDTQFSGIGAAYGTAKSGIGIANVGTYRPDLIMKV